MFKNEPQKELLTVLYAIGSNPLQLFEAHVENGSIKRVLDADIKSSAVELLGANLSTIYIVSRPLSIRLSYLVLIVKNLQKYFSFEADIWDSSKTKRRFRIANYQRQTKVEDFQCLMPLKLELGWNLIQINLSQLTKHAYGTDYCETRRLAVNGNCRLRRIYFAERLYANNELPPEYRVYEPPLALGHC